MRVAGLDCGTNSLRLLIADLPSSSLSQGTTAQHALVEVEPWKGPVPSLTVDKPPRFVERTVSRAPI